jgi:iron(III) transport system ATP-binding protein
MSVDIEHLSKRYDAAPVVADLSAVFPSNAISVLLGPSGCGKTTTLRCIAGLEEPNEGSIRIDGTTVFSRRDGVHLQPEKRDLGMVFQSYAIWPHMTVFENVALPLRARGDRAEAIRARVDETLAMTGLTAVRDRSATQLSGGQQQRVAIARCIATRPRLILMDEPLSNLDAKLRMEMRRELKQLQRLTGATMVFVTHDQEEALSLADTIFLFQTGRIVQQGAPQDIYRRPVNRYVAEFLGKTNLIPVLLQPAPSGWDIVTRQSHYTIARSTTETAASTAGEAVCVARPEAWSAGGPDGPGLPGRIDTLMFLGDRIELTVDTPIGSQLVLVPGYEPVAIGDRITLTIHPSRLHLLG